MTAEASTEAAFVAGTLEAAARVWEETGVDTLEEEDFKEAEQSLRDRFGLDLWQVLGVQKGRAREAKWRKTQRALAVRIEKITTPQFKVALTKEEKAVAAAASSLGAPGANDWLVTRPRSRRTTFENGVQHASPLALSPAVGGRAADVRVRQSGVWHFLRHRSGLACGSQHGLLSFTDRGAPQHYKRHDCHVRGWRG